MIKMRLPKTFIPEKNLEKKTEEFKGLEDKEPIGVSLDEFLKNNMEILYGYTVDERRREITDCVVSKIIDDTFENKIIWEKNDKEPSSISEHYSTKATILNYKKEPIKIPALFIINKIPINGTWGLLFLGSERGPSRNTFDKRIKQLAVEYFKVDPKSLRWYSGEENENS